MKCEEALILMNSVLDGEATEKEAQVLRFHLNGCSSCRRKMILNRAISRETSALGEPDPPEDLLLKVRNRLDSNRYDRSPLKRTRFMPLSWKVAAVVPFAAAAILLFGNLNGSGAGQSYADSETPSDSQEELTRYTPTPVVAYSRPSSVTTF